MRKWARICICNSQKRETNGKQLQGRGHESTNIKHIKTAKIMANLFWQHKIHGELPTSVICG